VSRRSLFQPKDSQLSNFANRYFANNRFWLHNVDFQLSAPICQLSREQIVNELCAAAKPVQAAIPSLSSSPPWRLQTPQSEFGLILAPQVQLLLPLHDGLAQPQHAVHLPNSFLVSDETTSQSRILQLSICGFARRAQHHISSSTSLSRSEAEAEEEAEQVARDDDSSLMNKPRPVDPLRFAALTEAIPICMSDLTLQILLGSDEFQGTSPARIARSFVCPRQHRNALIEPMDRAAKRCAEQIALAVRRLRADRVTHLRNNDRPVFAINGSVATSPSSTAETFNGNQRQGRHPMVLVLDNLRSVHNVGSLFRTSDTAGLAGVITAGITPHPPHCDKLRKTGFQAIDSVPTRHFDDILLGVLELKKQGYTVVAMETTNRAVMYTDIEYLQKMPLAVIVGNEITGVDARVLECVDAVVQIPTFGQKNSLNVAAAAPIMLFEVIRQLHSHKHETKE
jgi:tRNA G18 (ribose-2'-O)-methylase SpoU